MGLNAVYRWVDEHQDECVENLRQLIMRPAIAAQNSGHSESSEWLMSTMKSLGIEVLSKSVGGQPFVFGHLRSKSGKKTLISYTHYDVHPPNRWRSGIILPLTQRSLGTRSSGVGQRMQK